MAKKTLIVVGRISDGATSELVSIANEPFVSNLGYPVQLKNKNFTAASVEVLSQTYTATSNGAADGTTIINTAHTQANDYWNGYTVKMLSGTCAGETCLVDDFDAATDKLILDGVGFSAQIDTGDTYAFQLVENTDYTIDYTHGAITALDSADMFNATTYYITYTYNEPNLAWKQNVAVTAAGSVQFVRNFKSGQYMGAVICYTE